jgi:hypothetical protein
LFYLHQHHDIDSATRNSLPIIFFYYPLLSLSSEYKNIFYKKQKWKSPGREKEKPHKPKPEEREGTPQYQHCPPAMRHGDKHPKYHEEQQKDVA